MAEATAGAAGGGTSVGVITLDLIIKNTIGKQLEKIRESVGAPAEKMGEEMREAMSKPMEKAAESMKESLSNAMSEAEAKAAQQAKDIDDAISKALEKPKKVLVDAVKPENAESEKPSKEYFHYDTGKIAHEVEEMTQKLKKPVQELSDEMRETLGNFEVPEDPLLKLRKQIGNTGEKLELLNKKWQELSYGLENAEAGSDLESKLVGQKNAIEKQMMSMQGSLDKMKASYADMQKQASMQLPESMKFSVDSTELGRLKQSLEITKSQIEAAEQTVHNLQAALMRTDDSVEAGKIQAKLNTAEKSLISLQRTAENTEAKISDASSRSGNSMQSKLRASASSAGNAIRKQLGNAFSKVEAVGSKAMARLRAGFSKIGKSVKTLASPITNLGKRIKTSFRRVFVLGMILAAIRALKSGIGDVISQNENLQKSLNSLKANLVVAFTPIITAVMPILERLMAGLATVSAYVASFVAGIFGQTYQQAVAAAQKLKGVQKEAKKAKQSLAGFDEINTLSGDTGAEDTSGSKGIDYSALNGENPVLPDWAERMKDSIRAGDWAGVGSALAERVNTALSGVDWSNIQAKVSGAISGLTSGLNGFIQTLDWASVGNTVAGMLNTAFGAVNTFFTTFDFAGLGSGLVSAVNNAVSGTDWSVVGSSIGSAIAGSIDFFHAIAAETDWKGIGKSLGTAVNSMLAKIDFGKAAKTMSKMLTGLLDTAVNFLGTVDWNAVGTKIADFFKNIDWAGIAKGFYSLFGSIIGASVSLLWGAIRGAVTSIKNYFKEKIEAAGGNIAQGLLDGINEGFKNIASWIYNNLFKPWIDGFKDAFGIHSPSKVMEEMGGYIIEGLLLPITAGITKVKEKFEEIRSAIKEKMTSAWNDIKDVMSLEKIKKHFTDVADCIKDAFKAIPEWFEEKFNGIGEKIADAFSGIANLLKKPINAIIEVLNFMIGCFEGAVNKVVEAANKISFDLPEFVGGGHVGFNLKPLEIGRITPLAKGGLATAPTLAMVGDNRNAKSDPEVIAPLSKLNGMIGGSPDPEIAPILRSILDAILSIEPSSTYIDGREIGKVSKQFSHNKAVRAGRA